MISSAWIGPGQGTLGATLLVGSSQRAATNKLSILADPADPASKKERVAPQSLGFVMIERQPPLTKN